LMRRVVERPDGDVAEEPVPLSGREPGRRRRITADENDTSVVLERMHEHRAEPGVHEPEDFVVVEGKQDSVADVAEPAAHLGDAGGRDADRRARLMEEPSFGRLDGSAIEADDDCSSGALVSEEGIEYCGLSDARDPMQMGEKNFVLSIRHSSQQCEFATATHQTLSRTLIEQCTHLYSHAISSP